MKLIRTNAKSEDGSALIVAILLTALMSFSIAGYLQYVTQRNKLAMRSAYWNQCIPIAEAGVEDCLMNLSCNSVSNLTSGGWSQGTNCYFVNHSLASDSSIQYTAVITGTAQQVTNTVTGKITLPSYLGNTVVSRTVQVVATNSPLFTAGLVGIDTIDFNNKSISLNCDDAVSATNNNGTLNLSIVANIALLNLLDICLNADVSLGPNGAAVGANADVTGIINATANTDVNVQFNSVTAPVMSGLPPLNNVKYGGTNYTYAASGDSYLTSLNLTGTQKMVITAPTRLYVSGNFNIQDNAYIYVAPGASLQLYVGGQATTITGTGGVVVGDQDPEHFQYYGLDSNTSVQFDAAANVNSLIYAPKADVSLGTDVSTGGVPLLHILGTIQLNFFGAVVGKTVTFTTDTIYNYDQDTLTKGPYTGYVVSSWQEL